MSTTIDSLDIRIETSAGDSAANIEKLAKALDKLKASGKLTTVVNNLNRLASALDRLNTSSSATSNLNRLAQSLNGLSSIDAKGFKSVVTALGKIPKILDSLDASTLEKLKKKMEQVADAMKPLAERIDVIANGFSRLPNRIKSIVSASNSATNSTKKFGGALHNLDVFATIQNLQELVSAINFVSDAFGAALGQAMEWDGIQVRFGRAFGDDAEETYEYLQKIHDIMGINVQEFMQYSSMYGSLLSGFGLDQDKVTTIATGLSELTYDLWAANNDVAKNYEDAATAVKSAITGEIEPIRNLGIAMTEASLQEFIDSTHLAGISIENLSEAQKAEVRYAAMVNGAMNQGIIGTYAKEMNTAEGAVRSLTQSFKGLIQAFGSLFIPLLQAVIPYVTAFVELLTDAVFWVAKLFGIKIQAIDWSSVSKGVGSIGEGAKDASKGLGGAAKAAKKLKDYTMGFDELNVIDPDSGSSGSGGSGGVGGTPDWGTGLDLDTLWDDSVFAEASKRVDEIKEKILAFMDEWKWAFAGVALALGGLAVYKSWDTIVGWATKIKDAFRLVVRVFDEFRMGMNGASFAPLYTWVSKIVSGIRTFSNLLKLPVWAGFALIIGSIVSVVVFLYKNWDEVVRAVKGFFQENIVPKLEEIKKHIDKLLDSLGPFGDFLMKIGKEILKGVGKAFEVVGGIIFGVVGGVIATAFNVLVGLIENAIQIFSGTVRIISGVIDLIVAIFTKGDVGEAWDKIWDGVVDVAKGIWGLIKQPIVDIYEGVISWFTNLWDELVGHSIVPDMVNDIVDWFLGMPGRVMKPVREFVDGVISKVKGMWSTIKSWYKTNVAPKFTKEYWSTTFDTLRSSLKTKLDEAWKAVKDFFSVSEWKKKVDDAIGAIKKNFKMPTFPSIKLSVTWDKNVGTVKKAVYEALGLDGWPKLKWSTYDTGGFPSVGEAFIARENGPELVGRIGNKSTVANNDQIITGIAQGVYDAVRAAMSENNNGGSQNVNVYLDSKQIHASVKRTDESRGANIMGNQLGYLY